MDESNKYASPEQLLYARVLGAGVKLGFVLLVLTFGLYMAGVFQPLVPVDQLPKYWNLPVRDFVKATHTPTGWGWLSEIARGDMLNLVGIAVLAGVSAVSSLAILPIFARRGETALLLISVLQVVVLVVSASGILGTGH
jgi:ABC-type Na+ efflux pump permease subunit